MPTHVTVVLPLARPGAQARARLNWAAVSRVIAVASTAVVMRVQPASRYRRAMTPSVACTPTGLSGSLPENEGDGLLVEMGIGEFARRSRLSPKALRLYDGLGLLSPARVDELSGYRYYEGGQLEQARLIAALRQVGVPLTTVKELLALGPAEMAEQVFADIEGNEFDLIAG